MKLGDQVKQLTELMADLVPVVDKLAIGQEKVDRAIGQLIDSQGKTNHEISEMRLSNMRLADAIERLTIKIDKIDSFEERLARLEKLLIK
ncbi:MAG: hypothetical protein ACK514_17925 [Bacteroidota bacterium]|jgi:ABC-type transporter Mla subunit MlaD|nr:hypothetical protein [Cytophagales bacterium]MCE2955651.1 hypothetical protein [Flammeovirgaceae bacterium]MCZ8072033.1 hypothetical protein [Cytophagales bacterium]